MPATPTIPEPRGPGYDTESIARALSHHFAEGRIRYWRSLEAPPGVFRAAVGLIDGRTEMQLRSLREAFVFVSALASAKHAIDHRGGAADMAIYPDEASQMPARVPLAKIKQEIAGDLLEKISDGTMVAGQVLPKDPVRIEVVGKSRDTLSARVFYADRAPFYLTLEPVS